MPKCRMCSQEVHARGSICQECEWEVESARAWEEARDARDAAEAAIEGGPAIVAPAEAPDEGDAPPQALPQPGYATAPDVLRGAAETSYNLWRTRRGAALLLVIAGALAGLATLGPAFDAGRGARSVMDSEPGMLRPCSNAVTARPCLPSPPR